MKIPLSWLKAYVDLPEGLSSDRISEALVNLGFEVEEMRSLDEVTGPLVVGRVVEIEELKDFKKPIRYCQVDVGDSDDDEDVETRGIICGASNFAEGDLVVVALPGAVLPGGFAISARKTYGRTSNGMICSARELGLGDDHAGIMVLPSGEASPGDDASPLLGLDDTVIDLEITPDRGYAMSVRGLARELAIAFETTLVDPAAIAVPGAEGEAHSVHIEDQLGCSRFVFRRVTGLDPTSPTPWFIRRRLMLSGIRSISLAVDVTNYVMLETGQPMHAFDTSSVKGNLTVRRAQAGEKLTTLDDVERALDPDDIVIADETGPISLAGVMGGASTEVRPDSTDILLEAAVWDPPSIARAVRRHKLPSEASKRFERSVDPALAPAAAELAAKLLREHGEARIQPGRTDVGRPELPGPVLMEIDLPDRVAGINYPRGVTARRLSQIGCGVEVATTEAGRAAVIATPPTWRPDLTRPADLVEEVLRLEGYHTIPSVLPAAPAGRGLTPSQRRRRAVARTLADVGYVEVMPMTFVSPATWDAFGLPEDDVRRQTVKVLNPLEADRNEMTSTLLPGLLEALGRNVSRGMRDVALFHIGQVVLPKVQQVPVPEVPVDQRPSDAEIATLKAALPAQPVHVAVVLAGNRQRPGWWGKGEPATWADAVQAAQDVAAVAGVELTVQAGSLMPWHPGRCAELRVGDFPVGHAGELHPKVVEALGLPKRTCAMELDLDLLPIQKHRPAPKVSPYPPVLLDVALVLDASVPVAEVTEALKSGGGDLLEDLHLFDVYTGEQLGEGKRSLAYSLRFRAADKTLTVEEATAAKETAVAVVSERFGATLR
ncbi:phenylalanine--tRNA ligase subunit beta [Kibdelosporangium aridum]|uniref:Phenylalanine--tRNA ligase beta subunit n=1 Tax=Kibdelosporangium aridum TaxID=2030 RepID=A0A1W2E733_KIBAR|nr:phenylalanine--tRNA ligase subunit beta [Kibdelosporangium aridum]SMD05551.1 phenylalanyl-tRNA synthetase beta subunit [Kibdelosporangium aridum]